MRGRKPVPVEQRRLEGEDVAHRPLPEPVIVGGRISDMPPPLGLPPEAVPFWKDTLAELAKVGIIDRVDQPALIMLATQFARVKQAQRVLASEGLFASGAQGQVVEHPAVNIERKAMTLFLKYAEHYALTPVARTRLGLAELNRRSMAAELESQMGGGKEQPAIDVPEADVVEDTDVGLPGV